VAASIHFTSRFARTWRRLTSRQKERILDIIIALPELLSNPHQHSGYGFRKLKGTDFHEARLDIRLRLVMRIREGQVFLFEVMNHDEIRRL
jgi:mRNA-degrading endonuclease RelE of RelBE toxin-antitoxin system